MAKKKARLGRGLGALLGDVKTTTQADLAEPESRAGAEKTAADSVSGYRELPIEQLQRGKYQPRVRMDKVALSELSDSIKAQGVLQPLLVRPVAAGLYEIIAGERRWRGAQQAGLRTVPAVIREINDQTAMAVALIENIQRENLSAIEEAQGYRRLLDEFGLTHQEVSEAVGCSRTQVTNLLRLLALHPRVQEMLETGLIDMGHARALLGLVDNDQPAAAAEVERKGMSVRQTEALVRSLLRNQGKKTRRKPDRANSDIARLENDLSSRIGARVDIHHSSKKGKLVIHYHSLDELDGILERIR